MSITRLPVDERYHRDPVFRHLVDSLYAFVVETHQIGNIYTPTELREAMMCAMTKYEYTHVRSLLVQKNGEPL